MYSASVVDNATVFCSLDCHETAPPAYVITYPDANRLVSTSAHMSELVKPFSMGLLKPNWRHTLEVPLKYRSIHVTTTQGSLPRLPTYPISDLVQTIAYIKLPTTQVYGTLLISAFSIFFFGHCLSNSLLLVGSVELTNFVFSILNIWSTFIVYFYYDKHNNLFVLSQTMCIPRICFAGPISFIAKDSLKAFFKILILFISCLTINMLSP